MSAITGGYDDMSGGACSTQNDPSSRPLDLISSWLIVRHFSNFTKGR
jgi:hypothetical protein